MKKRFDRIATSQFGKRGLAVILCFVVLISAIGVGSALTTLVSNSIPRSSGTIPASIGVVIDLAKKIGDPNSEDSADDAVALNKKGDADLAGTGATYYLLIGTSNDPGTWSKYVTSSSATFTIKPSDLGLSKFDTGNYFVGISSSSSYLNMYSQSGSSKVGTYDTNVFSSCGPQGYKRDNRDFHFAYFSLQNNSYTAVSVSVAGGTNTTYTFSASTNSYAISYDTPTNGSFASNKPTTAIAGNSVSVSVTPATGYKLSSASVSGTGVSTTVSGNTIRFTMPSQDITVSATFVPIDYTLSYPNKSEYTVTDLPSTAHKGDTVSFTVRAADNYTITGVTTSPALTVDKTDDTYSFTMPASNVTISIGYTSNSMPVTVYFKSATAWVYKPLISVNGGKEQLMEVEDYLDYNAKNEDTPYSDTGSLRYAWYSASFNGVDVSSPVQFEIKGRDTYMNATGTFTIGEDGKIYLACDNLMEGNTLVDVTDSANRDFYDNPLNMIP